MNWKGMFAWAKCKTSFKGKPEKIKTALNKLGFNDNINSCKATQIMLGHVISQGKAAKNITVGLEGITAASVVSNVVDLLRAGNVIYLQLTPNHHFTVIPLSDHEISIMQGFQSSYNLSEWMEQRDDGVMRTQSFLSHLFRLLSSNADTAKQAARELFAIPGSEGNIDGWVDNGFAERQRVIVHAISYCPL